MQATKVYAKAGLDNVISVTCKHQKWLGLDVQFSALVLNFNYIFSIGHLYRAGHSTFITSHAMIGFDVIEILNNVLLGNGAWCYIIVVTKQVAKFGNIIAYCPWRIMFGGKKIRKFYKSVLCLLI
jgi:hypothetical protein